MLTGFPTCDTTTGVPPDTADSISPPAHPAPFLPLPLTPHWGTRAQLHVIIRRTDNWKDGRRSRHTDDTDVLLRIRIHHIIGELPTYGYRQIWAQLHRQAELDGMPAINAKRVYRIMRQNALLLEQKPVVPPSNGHIRERKQSAMVL